MKPSSDSTTSMVSRSALVVGGVAFTVGFVGPLVVSSSPGNLAPLLGVFVTGPLGVLAGAVWGTVRSAKGASTPEARATLRWLIAVWLLTMTYTLFIIGAASQYALPAAGLQGLIIGAAAFLMYRSDISNVLPERARRSRPIVLATLALVTLSTLFPPVTRPWWVPDTSPVSSASGTRVPTVAFIGDNRFDSSRQVPLFAVDRRALVAEWVTFAIIALAVSEVAMRRRGRTKPMDGTAP